MAEDRRRCEVFRDVANQWRVRGIARNGEIIFTTEAFTRKWSAKRAAKRLMPDWPVTVAK